MRAKGLVLPRDAHRTPVAQRRGGGEQGGGERSHAKWLIGALLIATGAASLACSEPDGYSPTCPDGYERAGVKFLFSPSEQNFEEELRANCGARIPQNSTCPDHYDNAGDSFTYAPDDMSEDEALSLYCGSLAPITRECPDQYDDAGNIYTYDPDTVSQEDSLRLNCGTLRPVTKVCSYRYDHAWKRYTYDPDTTSAESALRTHCGTLAPVDETCPAGYARAGRSYTYDPDSTSAASAQSQNCGGRVVRDDNDLRVSTPNLARMCASAEAKLRERGVTPRSCRPDGDGGVYGTHSSSRFHRYYQLSRMNGRVFFMSDKPLYAD